MKVMIPFKKNQYKHRNKSLLFFLYLIIIRTKKRCIAALTECEYTDGLLHRVFGFGRHGTQNA